MQSNYRQLLGPMRYPVLNWMQDEAAAADPRHPKEHLLQALLSDELRLPTATP